MDGGTLPIFRWESGNGQPDAIFDHQIFCIRNKMEGNARKIIKFLKNLFISHIKVLFVCTIQIFILILTTLEKGL